MSLPDWREEPIAKKHDRATFDCGEPALNEFLRRHARQSHDKGAAKTFLAVANSDGKTILGFYSLCPAALEYARAPEAVRKSLPRHEVPAFRLVRLAVNRPFPGKGLGGQLILAAGRRCLLVATEVGGVALLIDAKRAGREVVLDIRRHPPCRRAAVAVAAAGDLAKSASSGRETLTSSRSSHDVSAPDWNRLLPRGDHRWNMGVRRGDAAAFFAVHDSSGAVLAERAEWLAGDPETYAALLPEAEPALQETVQLARDLGAKVEVAADPYEQLLALGRVWEPDFAWMHPDGNGAHRLIGGVVCFPSSWALRKLGRVMYDVHDPVPGLNPSLAGQIESLFVKQAPGDVWLRDNVNFSRDGHLNHHPSRPRRKLDATVTPAEFWIRVERQLLLKLPHSGSILFGIRVNSYPIGSVMEDPPAAARLAEILSTMSPEAAAYKGVATARPQVISWLRQAADGQ